jgi:DNA-binding NtrC family response regulator
VQPDDLPFRFRTGRDAQRTLPFREPQPIDLESLLREVEMREIRRALSAARENRAKAARQLGWTRARLYRRLQQLRMDREREFDEPPLAGDE